MAKQSKKVEKQYNIAEMQPDELNSVREIVKEYVNRKQNILNEQQTLKDDMKMLDEEYSTKLDLKTLKMVEKHFAIQAAIQHKDTFDLFVETLGDPTL